MIRIKCFADFTTSEQMHEDYMSTCRFRYNQLYTFTTGEDYTHVFIFNKAMPVLHVPKQNVLGFSHEPLPFLKLTPAFIAYAQKHIGCYYVGDKGNLPAPFQEGNAYISGYLPPSIPVKPVKWMSIMISQKTSAPGHKYRHTLVQAILKTRLPVDIYGRGCMYYSQSDARLKGEFKRSELYDGYAFTICIENFRSNHYFSEKIINPLNQRITPVYLGCYQIQEYFPDMYVELTGNLKEDLRRIESMYKNPNQYIRPISLDRVDQTINLIRNLPKLIKGEHVYSGKECCTIDTPIH